jgi:7-cyano-7-deazaguanine synthase
MKVLLFTGGMDSTAIAWMSRPDQALFIDYGHRSARGEERAARAIADAMNMPLDIRRADMSRFGHGTMSASGASLLGAKPEFWPYRNQMLITFAAMAYAARPLDEIFIGTVAGDDVHPDGRKEFVAAIDGLVAQQSQVRVSAPAIEMSTLELIRTAQVPRSILGWTFSCHTGEWACGNCRGCFKHSQVMECLEVDDP